MTPEDAVGHALAVVLGLPCAVAVVLAAWCGVERRNDA